MLENAREALPLMAQLENAWHHTSSNQSHKDDYESVLKEATLLIEDENIRFAFIHLPVPHPPGIFSEPRSLGKGQGRLSGQSDPRGPGLVRASIRDIEDLCRLRHNLYRLLGPLLAYSHVAWISRVDPR